MSDAQARDEQQRLKPQLERQHAIADRDPGREQEKRKSEQRDHVTMLT